MGKIAAIDLYCDEKTVAAARKQLDGLGAKYQCLYYGSEASHPKELVLAPLRTWAFAEGPFTVDGFPFVTFIERDDKEPDPRKWPIHFIQGPDFSALKGFLG